MWWPMGCFSGVHLLSCRKVKVHGFDEYIVLPRPRQENYEVFLTHFSIKLNVVYSLYVHLVHTYLTI